MKTKLEREIELRALLQTQQGTELIIQIYRDKVAAAGRAVSLGRIGLLACQMIPRIIDAEFPA
ncbi:MAG: hypothetical protein HY290_18455 [Planctomycetia bacterium]|nr:hypothetical protein [Planctomycetia bacterium]